MSCITCGRNAVLGLYCSDCHKKAFPIRGNFGVPVRGSTQYDILYRNIEDISNSCAGWGNYYQVLAEKLGYCFGLVFMWGTAILHDDLPRYYRRLDYLTHDYKRDPFKLSPTELFDTLSALINYVTTEWRRTIGSLDLQYQEELKSLNLQSQSVGAGNLFKEKYKAERLRKISALEEKVPGYDYILEIRAFLDGLLLYQRPDKTSLYLDSKQQINFSDTLTQQGASSRTQPSALLFGKDLFTQNALTSSLYLTHQTIGNLRELFNRPYTFNQRSWRSFFQQLFDAVKHIKQPTFIYLSSSTHAIGLLLPPNETSFVLYDAVFMRENKYYDHGEVYPRFSNPLVSNYYSGALALNVAVYTSTKAVIASEELDVLNNLSKNCTQTFIVTNCQTSLILYLAAAFNHGDVITDLANRFGSNINPNQYRTGNLTPLYVACTKGYAQIVELLANEFQGTINPNLRTELNETPLFTACIRGFSDVVKQLAESFKEKIDPTISKNGETPLYIACASGYSAVVEELGKGFPGRINPNELIKGEYTAIYAACYNGHHEVVRKLAEAYFGPWTLDPTIPRTDGSTPFYIACSRGYSDVVEQMVNSFPGRINPNELFRGQYTPLYIACFNGHSTVVRKLAAANFGPWALDPNLSSRDGRTPLYTACEKAYSHVILIFFQFFRGVLKKASLPVNELQAYINAGGNEAQVTEILRRFCTS